MGDGNVPGFVLFSGKSHYVVQASHEPRLALRSSCPQSLRAGAAGVQHTYGTVFALIFSHVAYTRSVNLPCL